MERDSPLYKRLAARYRSEDISTRLDRARETSDETEMMAIADGEDEPRVLSALAANPSVTPDILSLLGVHPGRAPMLRSAVARNVKTPPDILMNYALSDSYKWVRIALIENPSTPKVVFRVMAREERQQPVREALAKSEDPEVATAEILEILAGKTESVRVRRAVAGNKNATAEVLELLSLDDEAGIRTAVAAHAKSSGGTLRLLAFDRERDVVTAVVKNPSTSEKLLGEILDYRFADLAVVSAVMGRSGNSPAFIETVIARGPVHARHILAASPSLGARLFDMLAGDAEASVRRLLARNSDASGSEAGAVLKRLSLDKDPTVRQGVAENPACPAELLDTLRDDRSVGVRAAVAASRRATVSVLASLASDPILKIREAVAANPTTPPDTLAALAEDSKAVARMVAANPATPAETLDKLANAVYPDHDDMLMVIADHPRASADLIKSIYERSDDEGVALACARNVNTPVSVFLSISRASRMSLRRELILNPALPITILRKMVVREGRRCKELADLATKTLRRRENQGRGRPRLIKNPAPGTQSGQGQGDELADGPDYGQEDGSEDE